MAKVFDQISDKLREFIAEQHVFFVATAPLTADGHINLSPKGTNCFRVLSPNRVAYLDYVGSGNETSAHLLENGRITFMFCAFDGAPNILRLYGTGQTIRPNDSEWVELSALFPESIGIRQIITADVHRVQTSCGYGVPLMDYVQDRDTMFRWADARGADALIEYQAEKNVCSIDGLPTPIGVELEN